jgi:hypothetical protein
MNIQARIAYMGPMGWTAVCLVGLLSCISGILDLIMIKWYCDRKMTGS